MAWSGDRSQALIKQLTTVQRGSATRAMVLPAAAAAAAAAAAGRRNRSGLSAGGKLALCTASVVAFCCLDHTDGSVVLYDHTASSK